MLVSFHGAGLMKNGIHRIVVERRCSMNGIGFIDVLLGKPFYVFIASLTAEPMNLSKFMIAAPTSKAPSRIVHARSHESCTTESGGQVLNAKQLNQLGTYLSLQPDGRLT